MRLTNICLAVAILCTISPATLLAQVSVAEPANGPGDIAPPADVQVPAPQPEEVLPVPQPQRDGARPLGRDLDLGQLQREFGPQGRQFIERNGDRGISFGLDMAERGISFGLRFANGGATPSDARAFGEDMGRRGRAFGLDMRDRAVDFGDELGDETRGRLPTDGRDSKFEETPGDITIEAPPLPLGQIYGRDATDRPVKFRREF